jgi:hypothetical protein
MGRRVELKIDGRGYWEGGDRFEKRKRRRV